MGNGKAAVCVFFPVLWYRIMSLILFLLFGGAQFKIQYFDWVPLVMAEEKLTLKIRKPTAEEVENAKEFVKTFEGRKPKTVPEVYARETLILHDMPPRRRGRPPRWPGPDG